MASDSGTGPAVSPQAKAWIDALCSGRGACGAWRLELLDQRSRRLPEPSDSDSDSDPGSDSDSGSGAPRMKLLPMRIRRSVPGLPRSLVDSAVRYLVSLAPYSGIIYEGEEIPGEWWPARTMWRMDQGMNGRDGTYTLVQDLVPSQADALDGVAVADSCSSVATTDWHWEELDVEDVSGRSSQGVTVAVQAVSRNEDGTLDYSVVTRTALTQDSGWCVAECDEYKTVSRRTWDNVYGTPQAPAQAAGVPFAPGGEPPAPCADRLPDGTLYEVQWRENEDCTWRVEATRTVPVPVKGASRSVRKTLDGIVTGRVDRSQTSGALPDPAGMSPGSSVEVKLTDAGLYDVETVEASVVPFGQKGATATQTAFRTEAEKRSNVTAAMASSALGVNVSGVPSGTAVAAVQVSNGVVRTTDARMTEYGTVDLSERAVAEKSVDAAQKSVRETAFAKVTTTVDRSQAAPGTDSPGVGRAVESRMTEGGRFDVEETVTVEKPRAGAVRSVRRTLDGSVETVVDRSQASATLPPASSLTPGSSVEVRLTEGGRYDVETVVAGAAPYGMKGESAKHNAFTVETGRTSNVTQEDAAAAVASSAPVSPGVRTAASWRLTESGTADLDTVHMEDRSQLLGEQLSRTLSSTFRETVTRGPVDVAATAAVDVGESVESSLTESGLWDTRERRRSRDQGNIDRGGEEAATAIMARSVRRWSQPDQYALTSFKWQDPGVRRSVSSTRQEDGSYLVEDAVEEERVADGPLLDVELEGPYSVSFLKVYHRMHPDRLPVVVQELQSSLARWAGTVQTGSFGTAPSSVVPSIDVSEDQYGLLNFRATLNVQWPSGSAGPNGSAGDAIYYRVKFAETTMAAGRGLQSLQDFFVAQYVDINQTLESYKSAVQAIVDAYAAALHVGTVPVGLVGSAYQYTIERASASVDASTGQWTASYADANLDNKIGRMFNLLPGALSTVIALAQVQSLTQAAQGGS